MVCARDDAAAAVNLMMRETLMSAALRPLVCRPLSVADTMVAQWSRRHNPRNHFFPSAKNNSPRPVGRRAMTKLPTAVVIHRLIVKERMQIMSFAVN